MAQAVCTAAIEWLVEGEAGQRTRGICAALCLAALRDDCGRPDAASDMSRISG